ncbi:MAG TPA: hypothetical protein VF584_11705 [Longimicrobium sp.]|jgi:hypothetical protein
MPGQLGTLSELISIPGAAWATRSGRVAPAEIAASALAIERRVGNRVPLPKESGRYALTCDRLTDIARELADEGVATRVWAADCATTARWAALSFDLAARLRNSPRLEQCGVALFRAISTFVPPGDAAAVAACLDLLVREEASNWPDHAEVIPLLTGRADVYRQAAADAAGLVEALIFR